jgi:hypothetical protein
MLAACYKPAGASGCPAGCQAGARAAPSKRSTHLEELLGAAAPRVELHCDVRLLLLHDGQVVLQERVGQYRQYIHTRLSSVGNSARRPQQQPMAVPKQYLSTLTPTQPLTSTHEAATGR